MCLILWAGQLSISSKMLQVRVLSYIVPNHWRFGLSSRHLNSPHSQPSFSTPLKHCGCLLFPIMSNFFLSPPVLAQHNTVRCSLLIFVSLALSLFNYQNVIFMSNTWCLFLLKYRLIILDNYKLTNCAHYITAFFSCDKFIMSWASVIQ